MSREKALPGYSREPEPEIRACACVAVEKRGEEYCCLVHYFAVQKQRSARDSRHNAGASRQPETR
jgi:hypothetical protein